MNESKLLTIVIMAFGVFNIAAQQVEKRKTGNSSKFAEEKIKETNKAKGFTIDANYPQLVERSAQAIAFNKAMKDHVMAFVNEFRSEMNEMTDEDREFLPEGLNYTLDLGYAVEHAGPEVISVSVGRSTYTGGAHPNHWSTTLNFDMKLGKEMDLADLFKPGSGYLKVISEYCVADVKIQIDDFADDDWINSGAGPVAENFKSWAITKDGLKFFFDPYQVAAYAAGDFEVTVPYEKFPFEMQSEAFYDLVTLSYVDGSPPNWCRNGLFAVQDVEFGIAKVKGGKTSRAYFHKDDGECPNGSNCRAKAYVIGGDELIVSRRYGDFVCSWFQPDKGSETVGWIPVDKLELLSGSTPFSTSEWYGEWNGLGNDLTISAASPEGTLSVKGNAYWQGLGDNIHIGEVDDAGKPNGYRLKIGGSDKYDCRLDLQRLGRFLIVSDNKMCGGVNVTFDGVYRKVKSKR